MNRLAHTLVVQEMSPSDKSKRQEMSPRPRLPYGVAERFEQFAKVVMRHMKTPEIAEVLGTTIKTAQRARNGAMTYDNAVKLRSVLMKRGVSPDELILDASAATDPGLYEWIAIGERLHKADPELFEAQVVRLRALARASEVRREALEDVSKPVGTEE